MNKTRIAAVAAVVTLVLAAGCKREAPATGTTGTESSTSTVGPAEKAGKAIGAQIDDATITAKVKTGLLQAPDVKGTHINVETERGVVQLSGFVSSQVEIDRAIMIAKAVGGVTEVQNKMSLKPAEK
jgi:hyperosmotically inducible periplasmic protein